MMKSSNFYFEVPDYLIAQRPPLKRGTSKLMVLHRESGQIEDVSVKDTASFLMPGSVIVFNDSRVMKARLIARSPDTGGKVEFLLISERKPGLWLALAKKAKKQKLGKSYLFPDEIEGVIAGHEHSFKLIRFSPAIDREYLDRYGTVPLPPYIKRPPTAMDEERYQTIYAGTPGSSAAPTAGLHFTDEILEGFLKRGIELVFITLNVGLGTFLPIRSERIEDHKMHEELFCISDKAAGILDNALRGGKRITAVGTTVVRALETAFINGKLKSGLQKTDIFIYPGYRFKTVHHLFTNFHTPGSTLVLLVAAFAGTDFTRRAYQRAVARQYSFFSYGDAMLIL